jgi:hypothetical protein
MILPNKIEGFLFTIKTIIFILIIRYSLSKPLSFLTPVGRGFCCKSDILGRILE